jgi:hypothetical protein
MYFGARYYDPQLGRFSSADTIIPEQSQGTQAWDRYAFVDNNPLRYTDPSGHEKVCIGYTSQGCSTWYETETPAPPPPPQPPSCAPGETCIVPAPPTPDYWDLDPLHPDYIALTGNWSPLGLAGFTGILVRDRYGRYYFGIGGNLGKSLAAGVPTFTLNGGYIGSAIDTAMPSQGNIGSFLGGLTINGGLGAVGGIAATASPSSAEYNPPLYGFSRNYPDVAPVAVEGGIFLPPSIGISATYSWAVYPSSIMGQVRTWFGAGP